MEWTIFGIINWASDIEELFLFYEILGLFIFMYHQKYFTPIKNSIYTLAFLSFIVGFWELPLFLLGANSGLIWIFHLICYMIPFPLICLLLKVKFIFGKKEVLLFLTYCGIATIFVGIEIWAYSFNKEIWNLGISFANRSVACLFLYYIFRRIRVAKTELHHIISKCKFVSPIITLSFLCVVALIASINHNYYAQTIYMGLPVINVIGGILFTGWLLVVGLSIIKLIILRMKE